MRRLPGALPPELDEPHLDATRTRRTRHEYLVEVFWSDDDEGYIAVVPDLPGCSAFGITLEAAVHEIGDATLAWIAACRTSGDPIPAPTTKARRAAWCLTRIRNA